MSRALVLSGGGEKGAYQAGVLRRLAGYADGVGYDAIYGASAGAVNAAFLAQYSKKDFKEAVLSLSRLWRSLDTEQVFKGWPFFGMLASLWKKSLVDSSPLRKTLSELYDSSKILKSDVYFELYAVSFLKGDLKIFRKGERVIKDIVSVVMASSAIPGIFPPVEYDGETLFDGCVRESAPLRAAIEAGHTSIDVVLTYPKIMSEVARSKTAIGVALRAVDIMLNEIMLGDMESADEYLRQGGNIRVFRPSVDLESLVGGEFKQEDMSFLEAAGFNLV